ncbi:Uncharacterized conserved protein [Belnapia rosea]|uniref:Uncharacterized conserved protein n=2 Tax=Belnapia rosea TaxID=938405 RepID=A0A1G6YYP0_9PROT|nr:Uncharacterized conserved protein [Belnapia rosea]
MSLPNYGVLVGRFDHFERDPENRYGSYFHGHVFVRAPLPQGMQALFRCAVDVKEPNGAIEYSEVPHLDWLMSRRIDPLPEGYHELARSDSSGAIDYVRSPIHRPPPEASMDSTNLHSRPTDIGQRPVWQQNVGGSALDALEAFLVNAERVFVFGAPFTDGNGIHDVHMNQGDPLPEPGEPNYRQKLQWYNNSGVWQDGAVFAQAANGSMKAFLVKFVTQTLNTDKQGHPFGRS